MVHPMHQCAAFPWQRPSKWCTACTNRNCFLAKWRKNGAPDAPMYRVSAARTFKMVHHVHQSAPFVGGMTEEWCTTYTKGPDILRRNLRNGASRVPIGADFRSEAVCLAHYVHHGYPAPLTGLPSVGSTTPRYSNDARHLGALILVDPDVDRVSQGYFNTRSTTPGVLFPLPSAQVLLPCTCRGHAGIFLRTCSQEADL